MHLHGHNGIYAFSLCCFSNTRKLGNKLLHVAYFSINMSASEFLNINEELFLDKSDVTSIH